MSQRIVATVGGGAASAALAFVAYDYSTCHPMRKMYGYEVGGALVRLHNIAARSLPASMIPCMTLSELSHYDGSAPGRPLYFSSEGLIYDASSSEMFKSSYSRWAGRDATVCLAKMSLDSADVNRTDWESLTDTEKESLRSWTDYFSEKYPIKGRLKEYGERKEDF